jgi:DNA-binding CsgD family transcriptional regulator
LRRGDDVEARRWLELARTEIPASGPQVFADALAWTEALIREASGDVEGAWGVSWQAWEAAEQLRYAASWRWLAPDLIRWALARGHREQATAVAETAEEGGRRLAGIPSAEGAALRCRGLLTGDADLLVAAAEACRKGAGRLDRALTCEDAAVASARAGRGSDARMLFVEALGLYEELGAVRDSARCGAAVRSAGMRVGSKASPRRAVSGWEALTTKEREVALMAAEGLTNPQIAERLFVSKYTVMTHLSHVFGKLGISSRVELAAASARKNP